MQEAKNPQRSLRVERFYRSPWSIPTRASEHSLKYDPQTFYASRLGFSGGDVSSTDAQDSTDVDAEKDFLSCKQISLAMVAPNSLACH